MTEVVENAAEPIQGRLPAEWEDHRATWIAWPHNADTWPGRFERIPAVFGRIVRELRRHEEVRVLVRDREASAALENCDDLGEGFPVTAVEVPTDDAWVRDFGPLFTRRADGSLLATCWRFDSWGGKYPPWKLDDAAAARMADAAGVAATEVDWVLEGGALDVNDRGIMLTTESCLLDAGRNPEADRPEVEARLKRHLGVSEVIWLGGGIAGDDTDGHVDGVARFVGERTVVAAVEEDSEDLNYRLLEENLERLRRWRDQDGSGLEVVELPMPDPVFHEGVRLPASYANFYIANGTILVPTYRSPKDARALGILADLFRGRDVVGIDSTDLVLGLGAIHCVTLQEPRGACYNTLSKTTEV